MKVLFYCLLFILNKTFHSYQIGTEALIDQFSNSNNDCIKKLTPILKILDSDEQLLLANSISSNPERCFDPLNYKKNVTSLIVERNNAYGYAVGNNTNLFIKSFECIINSGKNKLDVRYQEFLKNELSSLTPWGAYPEFTGCLSDFIKNVNYILSTRRRYLLTYLKNIDQFGVKGSDGNINSFTWKTKERDFIVNEFLRLQLCVNRFSNNIINILDKVNMIIANSKSCGLKPGAFDKDLGYTVDYPVPSFDPSISNIETISSNTTKTVLPSSNTNVPIAFPSPTPISKPIATPNVTPNVTPIATPIATSNETPIAKPITNINSNSDMIPNNGSASAAPSIATYPSSSGPESQTKPLENKTPISTVKPPEDLILSNKPINTYTYDPCYDYSIGGGIAVTSSSTVSEENINNKSNDNSIIEKISPAIGIYPMQYSNKYCPNLKGKDLQYYELNNNTYNRVSFISSTNTKFQTLKMRISSCISPKDANLASIINNFDKNYSEYSVYRNIFIDFESYNGMGLEFLQTMINNIKKDPGSIKEFLLSCEEGKCSCTNCPSYINTNFVFKNDYSYLPKFSFYFTKCGSDILFLGLMNYSISNYGLADLRYSDSSSPLISLVDDNQIIKADCIKSNYKNKSSCLNDSFKYINDSCQDDLISKCKDLSLNLEKLKLDFFGVKKCNINDIDLKNQSEYENLKKNCFEYINSIFIDSSLKLNLDSIINLLDLTRRDSRRNLRFLLSDPYEINDNEPLIMDNDSDISAEVAEASSQLLDIDGSSNNLYYAMAAKGNMAVPTALPTALPTVSPPISTLTTINPTAIDSGNLKPSSAVTNSVQGMNITTGISSKPPTLGSDIIGFSMLLYFSLILIL